jgi:hypothetical protein
MRLHGVVISLKEPQGQLYLYYKILVCIIRIVATKILNKQSRIADKGWSSSLVVWRGANNS